MGYGWGAVNVVPDGALDGLPRFDVPSGSPTPGSLVTQPNEGHRPLTDVPGTVRVMCRGNEVRLIELLGWLRGIDERCGDETDFHYYLEVDSDWALSRGIDLNRLLRVGNVHEGIRLPGFTSRRTVAIPLVKVELNSANRLPAGVAKPADWTFSGNCGLTFPFDHYQPIGGGPRLAAMPFSFDGRGPYAKISGAIITDHPHDVQHRPQTFFSRWLGITINDTAEWEGSVPDWHPGVSSDNAAHFARWTEIHPPDRIEILPAKQPRVTTFAIALAARVAATPGPIVPSCEQVEVDLAPDGDIPRPSNSFVGWEELRGPECFFPWGENADNGSWVRVFDDHIRIKARVCGGALGGSPGRFKAIYRVWWEQRPPGSLRRTGSFTTSDRDDIAYVIDPGTVGLDIVEFKICLGPGITWEKRLNMPDGQGSSWDLIARDNIRCATNTLWANQVLNGQSLTFSKAKFLGAMTPVHTLPLSSLGSLPPGTRVTFTWMKD